MTITFIHSADLHLGRVFTGLRHLPGNIYEHVVESGFRALEKLIDAAIEHDVDFVLFVGDVFDSNDVSLRTILRFRQQLERLKQHEIHVFISYGNHDPFTERRYVDWPENVTVFTDEEVTSKSFTTKTGQKVNIYGFSYMTKEIFTDKSEEYIKVGDAEFHIATLHGNVDGQTDHDSYAPFSVTNLKEKDFDYWALGHIHKRQMLAAKPPIAYSGNIQGMHRKELGEKGCLLVTLTNAALPSITFIPTADIIWHEEAIDITDIETIDALLEKIDERKERFRKQNTFVHIRFFGSGRLNEQLQSASELDDLLWAVNDRENEQDPFVWIVSTSVRTTGDWNREELRNRGDFVGELLASIDAYEDFDEAVKPLFKNRHVRSFVHAFSEEEKQALLERAERLLLTQFMKGHE